MNYNEVNKKVTISKIGQSKTFEEGQSRVATQNYITLEYRETTPPKFNIYKGIDLLESNIQDTAAAFKLAKEYAAKYDTLVIVSYF